MAKIGVSFYLRDNNIRVYTEALRSIGSPRRICFLLSNDGKTLLLTPYRKKDFRSHKVPRSVYQGLGGMNVSSKKMCRLLAGLHNWNVLYSYRIQGEYRSEQNVVTFPLATAERIPYNEIRQELQNDNTDR